MKNINHVKFKDLIFIFWVLIHEFLIKTFLCNIELMLSLANSHLCMLGDTSNLSIIIVL